MESLLSRAHRVTNLFVSNSIERPITTTIMDYILCLKCLHKVDIKLLRIDKETKHTGAWRTSHNDDDRFVYNNNNKRIYFL